MDTPSQSPDYCGFCGGSRSTVLYGTSDIEGTHYTINRCEECNAFFLSPPPSDEALKRAYSDEYYGEKDEKFESWIEKGLTFFRKRRALLLSRHIPSHGKVLDIGCGTGRFLQCLSQLGEFDIHGTELPGKAARRAAHIPGLNLQTVSIEQAHFEDRYFDAVTLFHVFEHLKNGKETLSIISRILKPGGILILSIPNMESFQSILFRGKWLHLDPPRHLFFLSSGNLEKILTAHDFTLIHKSYFCAEQNPFGLVQSILNCVSPQRDLLLEHFKGNSRYASYYKSPGFLLQKLFFMAAFPFGILSDVIESGFGRGATFQLTFRKLP